MTAARDRKRAAIDAMAERATRAGYRVHEHEPFPSKPYCDDPVIRLDLDGHGELFAAYFIRHPRTGYWRWWRGFAHDNSGGGDSYPGLRDFSELVANAAERATGHG